MLHGVISELIVQEPSYTLSAHSPGKRGRISIDTASAVSHYDVVGPSRSFSQSVMTGKIGKSPTEPAYWDIGFWKAVSRQ